MPKLTKPRAVVSAVCGVLLMGAAIPPELTPTATPSPTVDKWECFAKLQCAGDLWLQSPTYKTFMKEGWKVVEMPDQLWNKPTPITEIALMRSPCLGTCPSYSVTFTSDGSVVWDGYCCVDHLGKRMGKVWPWQFRRLASLATEIGFFDLESGYSENVTDLSAAFTSVSQGGKTRVIMNYANTGPARLWALEQMIDETVKDVEWSK